jgi:hypothetical protein
MIKIECGVLGHKLQIAHFLNNSKGIKNSEKFLDVEIMYSTNVKKQSQLETLITFSSAKTTKSDI